MRIIDPNADRGVAEVTEPVKTETQEEMVEALLKKQSELEEYAVNWGVSRFNTKLERARQTGEESKVGGAKKLLQMALEPTIQAIEEFVQWQKEGRKAAGQGGQKHCSLKYLEMVGYKHAAFIAIKVVLDSITKEVQVRAAAKEITTLIMDELKFRRFKEQAPGLFKYKMSKFTTSNYAHMARSMSAAVNYHNSNAETEAAQVDTSDLEVSERQSLLIGIKLLHLVLESTGMCELETRTKVAGKNNVKTEMFLKATPATLEWLADRNSALEELWPVNLPMVVPPLPWGPGRRGGYRFNLRGKHFLVRGISKRHAENLATTEMPTVYSALNRIQGTPWRINERVVNLLKNIAKTQRTTEVLDKVFVTSGGGLAGVPVTKDAPDVPKPNGEWEQLPDDVRKAWRKKQWTVKEFNHQRKLDMVEFGRFMSIIEKFVLEAALWFPHNIDFRGRVYPVTNFLSPQGDDRSKAVLMFAEGKALGPTGAVWLALHGANCLGVTTDKRKLSKCTLDERIQWIQDHSEDIERAAAEPLIHTWWADADDPLQFYAFCCEWADFIKLHRQGKGEEFVSSLPVSMDGTCNGLQHYSAMLRDPIGARAVNVVASERPQDIYQNVMDQGMKRLEIDVTDDKVGELAKMWMKSGLCDRKLAKAPVMTFAYGSKQFGFRGQLLEYVQGRKDFHQKKEFFNTAIFHPDVFTALDAEKTDELLAYGRDIRLAPSAGQIEHHESMIGELDGVKNILPTACSYMAKVMWDSLGDVVVAAQQGMSWMQKCARLIAKNGKCVEWRVPGTGYWVIQEYVKEKEGHIETVLAGKTVQCRVYTKTETPDPIKQGNAVAPNIVHSLDAAALMMTVAMCAANGIDHFHMVHDSYGVLAADAQLMADTLRRAFYTLYTSNDVVMSLYEQFKAQLPEAEQDKLPLPPEKGNLDLAEVMQSPYFFC